MSASSHSFPGSTHSPDVLGELLHFLSQPLTSLRCSLELSIDEVAEKREQSIAAALEQTESIFGMVQLMREYLDAERPTPQVLINMVALDSTTRSVVAALSYIAEVRGVRLRLAGVCTARIPLPESRLRLALQYLITSIIEDQPSGGRVSLLLSDGPAGAVLRVEGSRIATDSAMTTPALSHPTSTLRRVRLTIATSVLETAGASVVFSESAHHRINPVGFTLRIPRQIGVLSQSGLETPPQ